MELVVVTVTGGTVRFAVVEGSRLKHNQHQKGARRVETARSTNFRSSQLCFCLVVTVIFIHASCIMLTGGTRVKNPGICALTPNRMPSLCNR